MEGKIDKNGYLWIKRNRRFKLQNCPYSNAAIVAACGDWCPLFVEPYVANNHKGGSWDLPLCESLLFFNTFTDERGQNDTI